MNTLLPVGEYLPRIGDTIITDEGRFIVRDVIHDWRDGEQRIKIVVESIETAL